MDGFNNGPQNVKKYFPPANCNHLLVCKFFESKNYPIDTCLSDYNKARPLDKQETHFCITGTVWLFAAFCVTRSTNKGLRNRHEVQKGFLYCHGWIDSMKCIFYNYFFVKTPSF